ncbi:MAG: hypothetical protein WBQ17_12150 [Rhizomicrobium sp.]
MTSRTDWFRRFLLPGFAFKAVVIGGGYATGRGLVSFFMPNGPRGGLLGMILAMVIWSIVCMATFSFGIVTGSRDYRTFFRNLLGPLWPAFEITFFLAMIVILAVFAAAVATLIGAAIRFRRTLPATRMLGRLDGAQLLAAGAWLIALGAGVVFASGGGNPVQLVFNWPGAPLLIASGAALLASLLSAGVLIALPFAWTSNDGWGLWRKLRFSATSVIFCALGLQLAFWGFLEPWAA